MDAKPDNTDTCNDASDTGTAEYHEDVDMPAVAENMAPKQLNTSVDEKKEEGNINSEEKDHAIYTKESSSVLAEYVNQEKNKNDLIFANQNELPEANNTQPALVDANISPRFRRTRKEKERNVSCKPCKREEVIGLGTVGLFQNGKKEEIPKGASACINGEIIVGPPKHVRKVRDYLEWREKHKDLFSTLKQEDARQRISARLQRLRLQAKQREEGAHVYAMAVRRMRRRGWSIADKTPRKVDHTRFEEIKAKREAFRAFYEEAALKKVRESSRQKNIISQQLAKHREESQRLKELLRDAARLERERHEAMREKRLEDVRQAAEVVHAQREACKEEINECLALDEKYRREHQAFLRERVLTKASPKNFSSTWSYTANYPPGDWRRTFVSPLPVMSNAADSAYRKQWMAQLQEQRLAMGRAEVELIKQGRSSERRDAAYRGNVERAEALRKESEALRERKERLGADMLRAFKALHDQESEERRRRGDVFSAILQKKRELAAQQRRALEEEEELARTQEEKNLKKLRERAALLRSGMSPLPRTPSPCPQLDMSLGSHLDVDN